MELVRPRWATWSFLVYTGGLTVLGAALAALNYLSAQYGDAAYAGWALLVLAVLLAIAFWFEEEHPVTAGVFAFASLGAWLAFVAAVWKWFGWISGGSTNASPFEGFHVSKLSIELLVLLASIAAVRTFRFPLLVLWVTTASWFFVTDVLSSGGNWSAWVTIAVGLALLVAAISLDGGERRPYGFWTHVVAGLTIGGGLLYFWHAGDWHWSFIAVTALVYVWFATAVGRSSWAVLGAAGILAAATHFTIEWWRHGVPLITFGDSGAGATRGWVPPLVYGVTGFVLVGLGLLAARRRT
jgi:hypothetical protein